MTIAKQRRRARFLREVQEHLDAQRTRREQDRLFAYIRAQYGVPAQLGGRVLYAAWPLREGTIIGVEMDNLWVQFDGEVFPTLLHPSACLLGRKN